MVPIESKQMIEPGQRERKNIERAKRISGYR